jgi:formamidopyrimidine-DNA glycosylase
MSKKRVFEKDWCIISKLGLSGCWYSEKNVPTWRSFKPNIIFEFQKSDSLIYSDSLSYGTLKFINDKTIWQKEQSELAPDILDKSTKLCDLLDRLDIFPKRQNYLIEDALVDQQR